MHIHLPKPLHGWREFVGEVGIIVVGVLLALGAEQVVEAVHHRSQVHDAIDKLRDETLDNREVLDFDQASLRRLSANIDQNIAALSGCRRTASAARLEPIPAVAIYSPVDVAWQGARDNALIPLMPSLTTDNYSKIDLMIEAYGTRMIDLVRGLDRTAAAVAAWSGGAGDLRSCQDALLALNELKQTDRSIDSLATILRDGLTAALRGERIGANNKLRRRKD